MTTPTAGPILKGALVIRHGLFFGCHGQAQRRHAEERHAGARLRRAWAWHPTRRFLWVVVVVVALAPVRALAQSSSLWAAAGSAPTETGSTVSLLRGDESGKPKGNPVLEAHSFIAVKRPSPHTFRKHDIITIVVNESKRSLVRSTLEQEKSFSIDAKLNEWLRLNNRKLGPSGLSAGKPGIKLDFTQDFEGEGRFRRDERLTTRVPVTVVDVKPNGNLILSGRKYIKEDEEERIMTLTGECRSVDVLPDNTILSTQVANLVIESSSTGALRDATRRGWIPRAFDFLRPF